MILTETRFVVSTLDRLISSLIEGDHLVAIGSPAKLTTPSHPQIAGPQSNDAMYSIPGYGNLDFARSTKRVRTFTRLPSEIKRETKRLPTNPVAPVMATNNESLFALQMRLCGVDLRVLDVKVRGVPK